MKNQPEKLSYLVQVIETVTTAALVRVEAADFGEAEERAEEKFHAAERLSARRFVETLTLGSHSFGEEEADLPPSEHQRALHAGHLVEVSHVACKAGFVSRVAVSKAAWFRHVVSEAGVTRCGINERLWDILHVAWLTASESRGEVDALFKVRLRAGEGSRVATLKLLGGDHDDEFWFAVLLPEEGRGY